MQQNFPDLWLSTLKLSLKPGLKLCLIVTTGFTLFGCLVYRPEEPGNAQGVTVNTTEKLSEPSTQTAPADQTLNGRMPLHRTPSEPALTLPVLKSSDLKSVEQMLLQRDRATAEQKKLALEFVEDATRLATEATAQGLHNERSGLSKLFCDSAIEYPTVEGLLGCAEAIALADVSLDVRIKQFGKAAGIYRAIPAFARAIDAPLSPQATQTVEENIVCLEHFIWNLDEEIADCQIITNALKTSTLK